MRRRDQNFAGDTGLAGGLSRRSPVVLQRGDCYCRTVHGVAHTYPVFGERVEDITLRVRDTLRNRLLNHLKRNIGYGQSLSHPVRGVQGGVRHQLGERLQQRNGNRRPRREHSGDLRQGGTLRLGQLLRGSHHVHQRRR